MAREPQTIRFKAVGASSSVHVILERHSTGEIAVCPICDRDLVVALNWKQAKAHDGHPGVFCPVDHRHFQILLNIRVSQDDRIKPSVEAS